MGAPSRRAKKVRAASEFDVARLKAELNPPKDSQHAAYSWSLADIVNARNAQMRGDFWLPARLADSTRTDDAIAVARENRLAPQRCIGVGLLPAKGARGASIANEADALFGQGGVGISPEALADVNGCLADHGIAIGYNIATPRDDGSRVDVEMHYWPIDYVRWDPVQKVLMTRVDPEGNEGFEVPIVHGDGRWVVFKNHELYPWRQAAALLPIALVWARHAFATRDWAKSSVAHGNAKVTGKLPEGVALQENGGLTQEATAFLELLRALGSSDSPVGIIPAGSEVNFLTNNSTAWQVFAELVGNAEKAAARIYLGTDGTLGSQGGAPGVDIEALFGVAATKVEGDLACIERAILTGVIEPWCAINFGDSSLAPKRVYLVPDKDVDALKESLGTRTAAFYSALKGATDAGLKLTQAYVDALAADFSVRAPPVPAPADPAPAAVETPTLRKVRRT